MRRYHLTWNVVLCIILLSCANGEGRIEKDNSDTNRYVRGLVPAENGIKENEIKAADTINYDYKYLFSNDSISDVLYIKKGAINKKYNVPAKVEFKLILNGKVGTFSDKEFEGVALLIS